MRCSSDSFNSRPIIAVAASASVCTSPSASSRDMAGESGLKTGAAAEARFSSRCRSMDQHDRRCGSREPVGGRLLARTTRSVARTEVSIDRAGGWDGLGPSRMRNWNQVSQLKLFDSCEGMLADDERGRITYIPGFVDAETAQAWFTELHRGVRWRSERRDMYDREVDVPRLLGSFRLDPVPERTPTAILDAAERVVTHLGVPFNSVGLNLYRDGRDSVAPHNDHLHDIREGFPIALLSLG